MGKPVAVLTAGAGFKSWAATYDEAPNPLLALEQRIATPILGRLAGLRVADLCSGTGRWASIARMQGARVFGVDLSPEMMALASRKIACVALADISRLPLAADAADLAICAFGISYTARLEAAFGEMARIARRIVISDLHPAAIRAGWTRSFPIETFGRSFADLDAAARDAGLRPESAVEASFGVPEREIFARAGKEGVFDDMSRIPAIFVKTWVRVC